MLKFRRWAYLFLSLVLVAGLVTHTSHAAGMDGKIGAAAAASAASTVVSDGDACGDSHGCKPLGVCSASCGTLIALPVLPASLAVLPAALGRGRSSPARVGWAAPPDPRPPKSGGLS